jgi:hypothetical protein
MLLIDFGALWILAYLLVGMGNVIPFAGEKAALAFAGALGLKSLIIFCWMTGVGEFPKPLIQVGLSLASLTLVAILRRLQPADAIPTRRTPQKKSLYFMAMVAVLGVLFILSLIFASVYPITEADGIWYHIKGMVFLHEGKFDSATIVSQFRQYPPFLALITAYLLSMGVDQVKIMFPFIYLCLLVIFYHRALSLTADRNTAAVFTLILGTTPYFWWHSFLPFLDLTTGFYYSIGTLYWFSLVKGLFQNPSQGNEPGAWAFLSGVLFGLAAWSRLEFLLYDAIPLLLLIYALDRNAALGKCEKNKILLCFAVPLLFFSSLWFATLLNFDSPLERRVLAVGLVGLGMWTLVGLFLKWDFNLKKTRLLGMGALAVGLYLALMVAGGPKLVSLGKALLITSIRSISVHVFYMGTVLLGVFLFREKLRALSEPVKYLGWLLIFYPLMHFLIFSYSEPKWTQVSTYLEILWRHPGHSINLSDTRGMLAFYPILIFFIAGLPVMKRGFSND